MYIFPNRKSSCKPAAVLKDKRVRKYKGLNYFKEHLTIMKNFLADTKPKIQMRFKYQNEYDTGLGHENLGPFSSNKNVTSRQMNKTLSGCTFCKIM